MQQRSHAPELLVLAELPRVGAHGGLDGEGMTQERLALRITRERLPRLLAGRLHGPKRTARPPEPPNYAYVRDLGRRQVG
jgi:hypothetical protein